MPPETLIATPPLPVIKPVALLEIEPPPVRMIPNATPEMVPKFMTLMTFMELVDIPKLFYACPWMIPPALLVMVPVALPLLKPIPPPKLEEIFAGLMIFSTPPLVTAIG